MLADRLIRITSGFCICLAVEAGVGCTLPATASKPAANESKVLRIGNGPPREGRSKLQFVSEHEGWLANGKNLWRTTDGGKNWVLAYSGEGSWGILDSIDRLEFINSRTGWMLADRIYKTEDSGTTWTRLRDPDVVLHSIQFLKDGKRGWAAGEMYRPISPKDAGAPSQLVSSDGKKVLYPALFHTEDGGATWSPQSLPSSEGRLLYLCFLDADHGWASSDGEFFYLDSSSNRWRVVDYSKGNCPNRMLLKTTQWETQDGVTQDGDAYAAVAIYFLDSDQGWLSFGNGYLAKSTDGGRTWCDLLNPRGVWSSPTWQTFFAKIHFTNSTHGWGLGGDGSLQETNDGGATWQKVDTDVQFEDMCFLKSGNGWGIAKEGLFRISP